MKISYSFHLQLEGNFWTSNAHSDLWIRFFVVYYDSSQLVNFLYLSDSDISNSLLLKLSLCNINNFVVEIKE